MRKYRLLSVRSLVAASALMVFAAPPLAALGVGGDVVARTPFGEVLTQFGEKLLSGVGIGSEYSLTRLRLFNRSLMLVKDNYLEPERFNPQEMFIEALEFVERQQPEVLVEKSADGKSVTVSVAGKSQTVDLAATDHIWKVSFKLREVLGFVEQQLPDAKAEDLEQIEYAAINGMLSTLDPHSVFLKPSFSTEMELSTQGEFGGLGIVISIRDGFLTIVSPIPGTPAANLGLKAKDRIVTIGEESTINMPLEEAVERLRGPKGTTVTIGVQRDGWPEPKLYTVTREIIKIESVKSERLTSDVGYIWIRQFSKETANDVRQHLAKVTGEKALKGLVLDLRGNPGGLLEAAVEVSDIFLEKGVIVSTVGHRARDERTAEREQTIGDLPIIVLVDAGSASASEIVAGALKYQNRAIVMGEQTFGKGSVQVLYKFDDDPNKKTSLKLTIAQYLTPGDVSIQSVGIVPDVEMLPVVITDDNLVLYPVSNRNKENDLEKRFDSAKGAKVDQSKPAETISYYIEPPDEEDEIPAAYDEKVKVDFGIELARDMLAAHGHASRTVMLESAKSYVAKKQGEQTAVVSEKLKALSIDWTIGEDTTASAVQTEFAIEAEGGVARAGDEVVMRLTARNTGKGTLYRFAAIAESGNPMLDGREFIVGKLGPGEERVTRVAVKLPPSVVTRTDEVKLAFREARERVPAPMVAAVRVMGVTAPRYSFTVTLDDKATGNGNGKLDIDEQVALKLKVNNTGAGASPQVVSIVKNEASPKVFIKKGRLKFDEIAAGGSATGDFDLTVRSGFLGANVPLRLTVFDMKLNTAVSEMIRPAVGAALSKTFSVPEVMLKQAYDDVVVEAAEVTIEGAVSDAELVRDCYVSVNNNKVFYAKAAAGAKKLEFKAKVPLEEGDNVVSIVARKGEELAGYRMLLVTRRKLGDAKAGVALAKVLPMDAEFAKLRAAQKAAKEAVAKAKEAGEGGKADKGEKAKAN